VKNKPIKKKSTASKKRKKPARITRTAPAPITAIPQSPLDKVKLFAGSAMFGRIYICVGLLVLLFTTIFWPLLSARLQAGNADQLINPYLFEHSQTFRGASFPGQHTFLIKWPVFLIIELLGASINVYVFFTLALVLLTVGALVATLYYLERRPLIFGTLCLALASTLLMIPAQPYPGALLPVNMAMITTRNIEYIVLLAGIGTLIRVPHIRSRQFWTATVLLGLLFASDRLFADLSFGGAVITLLVYGLLRRQILVKFAGLWFITNIGAAIIAVSIQLVLNVSKLTHLTNTAAAGPYGFIHDIHHLILGMIYAVLGLLANMGANPSYGTTILKDIPHQLYIQMTSIAAIPYVVNGIIFTCGLLAAIYIVRESLWKTVKKPTVNRQYHMALALIATTASAILFFIISNHDYAVDARYLSISLFALFVSITVYVNKRQWAPFDVTLIGIILSISIVCGTVVNVKIYSDSADTLAATDGRNVRIAQVLRYHPVSVLVGDYWRVIPVKSLIVDRQQQIVPLSSCTTPRQDLSSNVWQNNLSRYSFAYVLSFDKSLTDYPACALGQIVQHYGKPNSSVVISGTSEKPQELLLFYDHGMQHTPIKGPVDANSVSTVTATKLSQIPNTRCATRTIMNIVAHQDDDLLFMNPDLARSIAAGDCVRTIYLTAGDAGNNQLYWLGRESGSKAAYEYLVGSGKDVWVDRNVKLADNEIITISTPAHAHNISLIFIRLPDGNINGSGFRASHYESLAKLEASRIKTIASIDGDTLLSSAQLTDALVSLMNTYQPAEVRTQAPINLSAIYPDHSDHVVTGRYASRAFSQYNSGNTATIAYYIGYPIHEYPTNIFGNDFSHKAAAFFIYGRHDGGVCNSAAQCDRVATYSSYLDRQYRMPN
jgi:LmbE family N-acetylglucosaminyl deacetylase